MELEATRLALFTVSSAFVILLTRVFWMSYVKNRSEKRMAADVIAAQERNNAQAIVDEQNKKIAQILVGTERINERQAKLIIDLTDQINRLLSQVATLTSDAIRHVATEKASQEANKRLEDELTESRH